MNRTSFQKKVLCQINNMDFRKQFQDISASASSQPVITLFRKAVVSVKKEKVMLSLDQLTKIVSLPMRDLPYILFRPETEIKDHVGQGCPNYGPRRLFLFGPRSPFHNCKTNLHLRQREEVMTFFFFREFPNFWTR